ncbi:MAG: peroxide stress protein YaaA [Epsilonproteobacteria bacterium]|nr:MAG: peroxide stress protein YaaA [Campylobacterota bacterium]RLA65749.1 MAG: peroxide stress protein YaaA [Campylobacterota bacterium]
MLVVISPAKRLDFEHKASTKSFSEPVFFKRGLVLVRELKKEGPSGLKKLMKISDKIADENDKRFKAFHTSQSLDNAKQAAFAFQGDTYQGLGVNNYSSGDIKEAQKNLRILSGLYGVLLPLDLIQPYRLEMGTKFGIQKSKNLYEYWKQVVTDLINQTLKKNKTEFLVNCASDEYFSVLDKKLLDGLVITPVFKDSPKGEDKPFKIISFFAKRARGLMASYIIQNKIKNPEDLKKFKEAGYKYVAGESTPERPVFHRKYQASA